MHSPGTFQSSVEKLGMLQSTQKIDCVHVFWNAQRCALSNINELLIDKLYYK